MGNNYQLIAVDGGGSKTRFLSFDTQGTVHKHAVLRPSNPNGIGIDACVKLLIEGIRQVVYEPSAPALVCLGVAGTFFARCDDEIEKELKIAFPHNTFECRSDVYNLMRACDQSGDLMAAICGTGCSVFVQTDGQLHLFGGWGSLISPKGSGLDIVRDAVRAVLEDLTRMGPRTSLTQKLCPQLGSDETEIVRTVYQMPASALASLSPFVFEALSEEDAVAQKIVSDNIAELCRFCRAAHQAYPGVSKLFLSGGVATHQKEFEDLVRAEMGDSFEIETLKTSQLTGACLRCLDLAGIQDSAVKQKLVDSLDNNHLE